ncbi:hypothetical protein V8G54_013145 [Vigna mungo]|uniref:Leucine-rich repeat-containing N-terminal plant-type domain-containing protein n=1 Tax=Vigna mungo TaxID=3915 RepID=A0AAQ3S191_VIGMU
MSSFGVCRETVCIGSERETLLKLKDHLIDPSNRLSSCNASLNPNCCHWYGVLCNNITSHVAELHLTTPPPLYDADVYEESLLEEAYKEYSRRAFSGEINPCLVDLKHLNYLDLSYNLFYDVPIPSFIATMTSLTHLNLSYAGFMGNIPPQIGNLSNLLYLDLSYATNGTIPSQIGNLSNLLYLDLSYAFNGRIPPQIGNLSNLLHLDLRGRYYDEESLFYENVDWLSSLSKLSYLDLSNTWSLGGGMPIPSFLGSMTNLIHLDLFDSGFMGNIPPQIGNLSNLAYLDLSYAANGIIPSEIGNLSNLLYLHLGGDYFVGNDDWLSSLSKLEYLDLGYANLSQSFDFPSIVQALPSLMHLQLSRCTLPPYNQPSFLNISSLVTLDLSFTSHFSTISFVPKWIFGLQKLVSLFLDGNYFKGPIPDGLRNLTLLENLDLQENSFSYIPDWFYSSFLNLKILDLSRNNLQGTISDALGNMTSLVAFDLSSNKLEGPIPTSFGYLCNLRVISLSYLKLNQHIKEILDILSPCIFHGLTTLQFESSQLSGNLPVSLGKLSSLRTLSLSKNQLSGNLPVSIGKLSSVSTLSLYKNQLSGNPFESLRSLSKLSYLDIGYNRFEGVVMENHLINLVSLSILHASENNLTLKVGPNWHPTFQLTSLDMSSWKLGPNFPSWIQSQNKLDYLAMPNTGILDSIPYWFWKTFSQTSFLDLSHNHIHGELGTTLKNPISIPAVDLSANNLRGKLPLLSNRVGFLDLSSNSFSKSMDDFLCKNQEKPMNLEFLNLASNNLSGEMPDCWYIWPYLVDLNLQNNNFVGNIPQSMGSLTELQSLQIRKNLLSGTFPTILRKTKQLILLDIGENNFSGTIPDWVGESFIDMKVLILRSNRFFGHIPIKICDMSLLQVLDLAQNNLTENVPTCFNSLKAMTQMNKSTYPLIYCFPMNGKSILIMETVVSVLLWLKGRGDEYKSFLGLVTSIDLSNNKLVGEIPREITDLNGLLYLNLSHNQLIGHIPQSMGNMESLLSIDFSRNKLSGEIPPTISNLSFLSMLDLSYNNLNGKIPTGTQLQTFDASNFIGNNLCGPPLPINCSSSDKSYDHNGEGSDKHGVKLFFVGMTFGFVVGFWIVVGPLVISRSWRYAYFHFLDHVWFKLQYFF